MISDFPDQVRLVTVPGEGPPDEPVDVLVCGDEWSRALRPSFSELRARFHARRVAVYSPETADHVVELAFREGAAAYLDTRWGRAALVNALTRVHAGERVRPDPTDGAGVVERLSLSTREMEILSLVGAGLSNSEIAEHLYLSINTVKSYIRSGYAKAGVCSRSQAVLWVLDHGLTSRETRYGDAAATDRTQDFLRA
jgi:DNA-binding NarL/FixJ family response regulator